MILLILVLFSLFSLFHHYYLKRRNLPPGPTPLPLFGNVYEFAKRPPGEEVFIEWRKTYGKVYTVWFGLRPLVVVADYNLMVETFIKDADTFIGRGDEDDYVKLVRGGMQGVTQIDGQLWLDQRRFVMRSLRNFGLGSNSNLMQERLLEEIQTLISRVNTKIDEKDEFLMCDLIDLSVGSIINSILFGYFYTDSTVDEFTDLKKRAQTFVQVNGHPAQRLIRDWPTFYRHIPYFKSKFNEVKDSVSFLQDFFRKRSQERLKEFRNVDLDNTIPTDFAMAFIQEWNRRDKVGDPHYFNEQQMVILLFDLWVAGQETTSNTIIYFLAYLIHHPEVEQKAHEELDRVIGSDRLITLGDKINLPYINAIIMETQRIANLVPINLFHRVTKDVTIEGYLLKKGTWISPQVSCLLYDPEIYENPKNFNPDRFIDENGKLIASPQLLAFSIGKRNCLGESLARMELFLFVSNLLNQFKFSSGKQMPSLERKAGVTVRLDQFMCHAKNRFS